MRGQASVMWTARPGAVGRAVLSQAHVVGAVLALPFAVALGEGERDLAVALGGALTPVVLAMLVAHRAPPARDLRQIEAAAVFVFLFVGVSALAAPAYLALGLSPVDAVFESVSAVTSTGLTVAADTMTWPLAGHALRAWMQWCGGFAIAVAGVALILGPGQARGAAQAMGRAGLGDTDLLQSTRAQARSLLGAYLGLTAIAIAVFLPLFPTWWEAVAVALTAVSTGGMTPRADSLASYSRLAQSVVMLTCIGAAISLMAYVRLRRDGPRAALSGSNAIGVVAFALAVAVIAAGLQLGLGAPARDGVDSLLNALSGVTTAGFSVAPTTEVAPVTAIMLAGMIVGGGTGSTAGGVKLERLQAFLRIVRLALVRLKAPPRAITPMTGARGRLRTAQLAGMVAIAFLYASSLLTVWLVLLLGGVAPMPALFDSVSALSTVGLTAGAVGPDLAAPLKLVLAAAMLLGRLEFLALIAVLMPGTWAPLHR